MNTRIEVCPKDTYYLEKLSSEGLAVSHSQPQNYKDLVVLKPWGFEFLAFENEHVAIWFLYIKEGHSTSMHCHPQKMTTLSVLGGEAFCTTFMTRNSLKHMDAMIIEKGVFHSTTSMSPDGLFLFELETPPNKTDLVRFDDKYGRSKEGYEPTTHMEKTNLERFGYFYFDESNKENSFDGKTFKTSLCQFNSNEDFSTNFSLAPGEKAMVCRGSISWGDQHSYGVGEIFDNATFANLKRWIPEPATFIKFQKADK